MKIYSPNKNYSGISASVHFINGVGETSIPHLILWFQEHGYIVEEQKQQTSIDNTNFNDMAWAELKKYAEEHGIKTFKKNKQQILEELLGR